MRLDIRIPVGGMFAVLGILLAGGVVVATMPLLRAREIEKVTTKARVSLAW